MGDDTDQRAVHKFLREHFRSQEPFSQQDLYGVTAWTGKTGPTYWSKHYQTFVVPTKDGRFIVGQAFRPFLSWAKFQRHVSQVRTASSDYHLSRHDHVLIFEFFMPLTHEGHLRTALDDLFYKNSLLARLRSLDQADLGARVPRLSTEDDATYHERICAWLAARFVGYSVSHVSGRFRGEELATMAEAASIQGDSGRYLIDETTAVVRFIFPCGGPVENLLPTQAFDDVSPSADEAAAEDAAKIRWFFNALFVQSIVQVVNGEAEIWMVESGMRRRLYIWKV